MHAFRQFDLSSALVGSLWAAALASAQNMPPEYDAVMSTLAKKGDYKDGVLKVNIPRGDLSVKIRDRATPTPFGFGGWVAFAKASDKTEVVMGDLVLTE